MAAVAPLTWLARFQPGAAPAATFLDRGLAMPATTPALLGARVRLRPRGTRDLVLAHPGGAEGLYPIAWAELIEACRPTLHDRIVWRRLALQQTLSPRLAREAGRAAALDGLAGRAAARAAGDAVQADAAALARTQAGLMAEFLRQAGAPSTVTPLADPLPEARPDPTALPVLERQVRTLLQRDLPADATPGLRALGELAEAIAPLGLLADPAPSAISRLVGLLEPMAAALEDGVIGGDARRRDGARLVADATRLYLRCLRAAAAALRVQLDDLRTLVVDWDRRRADMLDRAARPDWLMEGWDVIAALWRGARPAERAVVLVDIAALVPPLPAEAASWAGFDAPAAMARLLADLAAWRRHVSPVADWQGRAVPDLVMRNEALRTLAP